MYGTAGAKLRSSTEPMAPTKSAACGGATRRGKRVRRAHRAACTAGRSVAGSAQRAACAARTEGEVGDLPHHVLVPAREARRVVRLQRAVQVAVPEGGANGATPVIDEGREVVRVDDEVIFLGKLRDEGGALSCIRQGK